MNYLDKTGLTRLWSKITGKLGQKQDTLVSGTNIKTINGTSLLGSGNIDTNEYKFCTEGGFWYSFKGVTSLDGITATVEGTEVNIIQLLPEFIHSPKAMEPLIDEMIAYLKMFKISPSVYIDSTTSKYLLIDIKGYGYPQSGTIRLRIRQVNNEYVFTELEVWGSEYIYYYHVDNFDISPVEFHAGYDISYKQDTSARVTSLSSSSTDTQYPSAKCVYDNLQLKQNNLISGTNIKTINNQNILGSGNINISGTINSDVEQKHSYNLSGQTYYYQFYGVSSIDNITVNVGVEVDVIYATLALIMQSIEELGESYAPTLTAIQGIHVPDDAYETNTMIITIHNLGCMTCYIDPTTKYVTQAIFTNFEQGYSVNFGQNPSALTIYYSALNSADYLSKTNTTPYTPNNDYNPATKKYVDDAIAQAIANLN